MSGAMIIKYGKIAGGITAISILAGGLWAFTGNDAPPMANIARVDKSEMELKNFVAASGNRIEALVLQGNIRGTWRDYCAAMRMGNRDLEQTLNLALSDLQAQYRLIAGTEYQLRAC